ncbi:MAG: DUF6470 family protein [Clostridia bacterium]|jgi:hypothetical protein
MDMELRISRTYGQIGIETHPSKLSIQQPPPRATMKRRDGRLEIRREPVQVLIDQSRCFAEAGRKPISEMGKEYARLGREAALEAIGRIAEEGRRLMAIEKKENVISQIARERMTRDASFNIAFIPSSRPEIRMMGGTLDIEYIPGFIQMDWEIHTTAEFDATLHKVDIYMRQWPELHIEVVGKNLNRQV